MYQPYPGGGQSAEPLRPPAPGPVLTAVKLMYAGAAVSAVNLIISLAVIGGVKAYLARGNKQAPWCPVPGVASGATRPIKNWRLDRERLAAVTAAVAPDVPVIDGRNDPDQRIEGPGQRQDRDPHGV